MYFATTTVETIERAMAPIWDQYGQKKDFYAYVLSNNSMSLYVGVTNDLERRFYEHTQKVIRGFTSQYHFDRIVLYEMYEDVRDAIAREKQLKGWTRKKKIALVKATNPDWRNLLVTDRAS